MNCNELVIDGRCVESLVLKGIWYFSLLLVQVFTMESGRFALGLDFKMERATCELSPEGSVTAL